jgi:hypothetical protein
MQRKRKLKRKPNKTICKPGDFTKQFGVKLNTYKAAFCTFSMNDVSFIVKDVYFIKQT